MRIDTAAAKWRPLLKLTAACVLAVGVTLSLLAFMRFLLGGDNAEARFTRLFTLSTVALPQEPLRPAKPAPVSPRPDIGAPAGDDLRQQAEPRLAAPKLAAPDLPPPPMPMPEAVKPKLRPQPAATKPGAARERLILILEEEEGEKP